MLIEINVFNNNGGTYFGECVIVPILYQSSSDTLIIINIIKKFQNVQSSDL